jgi:hypothetical protein
MTSNFFKHNQYLEHSAMAMQPFCHYGQVRR